MKKSIVLTLAIALFLGWNLNAFAQDNSEGDAPKTEENVPEDDAKADDSAEMDEASSDEANKGEDMSSDESEEDGEAEVKEDDKDEESKGFGISVIRDQFIDGGAGFMSLPLLCLIFGLAIVFERLLSFFMISTNSEKFIKKVENALQSGGIESAKDVARNTPGPVASIFYQGLDRADEGLDQVEKSVVSYGSVQMGQLERGLVWVSLFIALAPMLGFMGTVIGMIGAFQAIENAGDISPQIVAKGIKVALLTTVAGLIVAIILQVFYNLLVSKIDSIVNNMEDSSIRLVDMLIKNGAVKAQ